MDEEARELLRDVAARVKTLNEWHEKVDKWRTDLSLEVATLRERVEWVKWIGLLILGVLAADLVRSVVFR